MANKNNGSGNGSNVPWWVEKTLWRLEAAVERLDTSNRLKAEELKKHDEHLKKHDIEIMELKEISKKLSSKSDKRDEILTDHAKAIKILLRDLKVRSK